MATSVECVSIAPCVRNKLARRQASIPSSAHSMTRTTQAYTRNTSLADAQPLPSRLVRLLYEARWLAFAVATVYLLLIFLTYSKADPGWSQSTTVPVLHN